MGLGDEEELMTSGDAWSREAVLAAFDEHLRKSRGLCPGTRDNYCRFVELFLQASFPGDEVEVGNIRASQVIEFIAGAADRYQPKTVELVASSLRSFFRFARAEGLRADRLDDAVPMVPHRRKGLVRHLDPATLERLITSLESSSARDLRDRAIILCVCRLGLRASEVVRLRLEDIDWREGWLYLATVIDLASRRVVGWAMADHMRASLVCDALQMAIDTRRPGPGLIFHSD